MEWYELGIQHFHPSEFDSPDLEGSGYHMDVMFVKLLDCIRIEVDKPLIIDSGVRTIPHNRRVGGVVDSSHLITTLGGVCAADIRCTDSGLRREIILSAERNGINRIGMGKNFIHLDKDNQKTQNVWWNYGQPRMSILGFGFGSSKHDR